MDDEVYKKYKRAFSHEQLPLAYVDLDNLDANIQGITQRAKGVKIRIATKSVRSRELLDYILNSQPSAFSGLLSFHLSEANWLAESGFDNLLVAYPYFRHNDIQKTCELRKKGKDITLMADCITHLQKMQNIAKAENCNLKICLDIDMSSDFPNLHFGVYRSSIRSLQDMESVLDYLKYCPNLILNSLMGYEAQIAGLPDNNPFQKIFNYPVRLLKKISIVQVQKRRQAIVRMCQDHGYELEFVNAGGTGSIESTIQDSSVTEVAAGSGFYSPRLFDFFLNFKHLPAAGFALEITRNPSQDIYTCAGGGYVASGAMSQDKMPFPFLPEGSKLTKNEMAGEVQTPIVYNGNISLQLGDPIIFRHSKAGELCERFKELKLIRNGEIEKKIPTYRGEQQCFL